MKDKLSSFCSPMKIAYLSDKYGWDQYGVKRSLYQTLASKGCIDIHFIDYKAYHPDVRFAPVSKKLPYGTLYKKLIKSDYTHIFFASSCLSFELELMRELKERFSLIGFGFSDPRFVDNTRQHWLLFDSYFSLSQGIVKEARSLGIKSQLMLPSIHPGFHNSYIVDHNRAEFDAIFFGNILTHPDAKARREIISKLQGKGCKVLTVGQGGLIPHVEGHEALKMLANARIGINVMNDNSTLPHRIFEYAAANNCLLTTPTEAISSCFDMDKEAISLSDADFMEKLNDVKYCSQIAWNGRQRCISDHSIVSRAKDILALIQDN